jgi:hypothetical protein
MTPMTNVTIYYPEQFKVSMPGMGFHKYLPGSQMNHLYSLHPILGEQR